MLFPRLGLQSQCAGCAMELLVSLASLTCLRSCFDVVVNSWPPHVASSAPFHGYYSSCPAWMSAMACSHSACGITTRDPSVTQPRWRLNSVALFLIKGVEVFSGQFLHAALVQCLAQLRQCRVLVASLQRPCRPLAVD